MALCTPRTVSSSFTSCVLVTRVSPCFTVVCRQESASKITELRTAVNDVTAQYEVAQAALDVASQRADAATAARDQATSEASSLRDALAVANASADERSVEVAKFRGEQERLQDLLLDTKAEVQALQASLQSATDEVGRLTVRCKHAEQERGRREEELSAANADIDRCVSECRVRVCHVWLGLSILFVVVVVVVIAVHTSG